MPEQWFADFINVLKLARWLEEDCVLESAKQTIQFFESPWNWQGEWNAMQAGFPSLTAYEEALAER